MALPGILPKLSKTPGTVERKAPTLGQDTDEVLVALGFDKAELAKLREQGVI